jgi:hypothetical protein
VVHHSCPHGLGMINSILLRIRGIGRTDGHSWIFCRGRLLLPKIRKESHCCYRRQASFRESGGSSTSFARATRAHLFSSPGNFRGLDFTGAETERGKGRGRRKRERDRKRKQERRRRNDESKKRQRQREKKCRHLLLLGSTKRCLRGEGSAGEWRGIISLLKGPNPLIFGGVPFSSSFSTRQSPSVSPRDDPAHGRQ